MTFDPSKPVQAAKGCDTGARSFDPSKPVMTRDGRPARIICTDRKGEYPILALIDDNDGFEGIAIYFANGKNRTKDTPNDLVNAPTKRSAWINIYRNTNIALFRHDSEEAAYNRGASSESYVNTIKIEWEE